MISFLANNSWTKWIGGGLLIFFFYNRHVDAIRKLERLKLIQAREEDTRRVREKLERHQHEYRQRIEIVRDAKNAKQPISETLSRMAGLPPHTRQLLEYAKSRPRD